MIQHRKMHAVLGYDGLQTTVVPYVKKCQASMCDCCDLPSKQGVVSSDGRYLTQVPIDGRREGKAKDSEMMHVSDEVV